MICLSPKAYNCIETLFYYPYTIGAHLDKAVSDTNTIESIISSLTYVTGVHSVTIRNIGTISYISNGTVVIIQDISWSPTLTRFYYVKSNFITFSSQGNVPSVHPSMYTDRDERHFMCDNGYKVVSRKFRGKEYFNFKDTKGNIISDIDFTQVKPFSRYKDMTARGYTPNRRCYMVFDNGDLDEVNENKQYKTNRNMKQVIRLTESDLHRVIKESVNKILNEIGDTKRGQFKLGRVTTKASRRAEDAEARGDIDKAKKYDNIAKNANSREADDGRWFQYGLGSPF